MKAAAGIITLLRADPELTAAVGERIRTGDAGPVDVRPYLLLWEVTATPVGDLAGETGMDVTTVQLDLYADSAAEAGDLARKVCATLAAAVRGNVAGTFFHSLMRASGPRQTTERIGGGSAGQIHRVTLEYRAHHSV